MDVPPRYGLNSTVPPFQDSGQFSLGDLTVPEGSFPKNAAFVQVHLKEQIRQARVS